MEKKKNMVQIVTGVREQIHAVTGFPALSVVSLEKVEDGWSARVEVTELQRVPDTQDLVGVYDVSLDGDGDLVGFDRMFSRIKGQPVDFDDVVD